MEWCWRYTKVNTFLGNGTTLTADLGSSTSWGPCWNFFMLHITCLPRLSFLQGHTVLYQPLPLYFLSCTFPNKSLVHLVLSQHPHLGGLGIGRSQCMSEWQEMGMLLRAFNVNRLSHVACRFEFLLSCSNYHHPLFLCHQLPLSVSPTWELSFMESGKECNCALLKCSILSFKEQTSNGNHRRHAGTLV